KESGICCIWRAIPSCWPFKQYVPFHILSSAAKHEPRNRNGKLLFQQRTSGFVCCPPTDPAATAICSTASDICKSSATCRAVHTESTELSSATAGSANSLQPTSVT